MIQRKDNDKLRHAARLLYIDHSSRKDSWDSILHSHPFTELFYVIKGSGFMKFSNTELHPIKEGDLVIVNPNVWHTELCNREDYLEYIVLGVDGIAFDTLGTQFPHTFQSFYEHKHEILVYLNAIRVEVNVEDPYASEITSILFQALILNILRRSDNTLEVSEIQDGYNKNVLFIESYINEHFHMDITLDHLAEVSFLDKFYLVHLFKKHTGMAPIEYLLQIRLEESRKLLMTTDFSISHIASMLGFSSSAYFSQFFKKKTDLSPTEFRRRHLI